jgi:hypothetical protein
MPSCRPGYAGPRGLGRDDRLYFAYVDMPTYAADGHVAWAPHYFEQVTNGKPVFSTNQADAAPLDLSAGAGDTTEAFDMVNQGSVISDGADVYWNVSTYNPYGVVLMKTHIGR